MGSVETDRLEFPWEPAKFAAALQNASQSGKPVLLKVSYDNGHFTEEKVVTSKNFAGQFTSYSGRKGTMIFSRRIRNRRRAPAHSKAPSGAEIVTGG